MKSREVSIIIPTYNSATTLARCLRSIKDQSCSSVEVIVVDGLSNDSTLRIAQRWGAKIIQRRSTPALARNLGVRAAAGKYVFFVDSDQSLSKSLVEECVWRCENENAGMVRVPEVFVGANYWGSCSAEWKNSYVRVEQRYSKRTNIMIGEPRFFLKELITKVGMLDPALVWGEDLALYTKLKERKIKEIACTSILYHHEPASLKSLVMKNLRYGKSIPAFVTRSKDRILSPLAKHSLLVFKEISKESGRKPATALGCTVLLGLKAYAMMIGLLTIW
jgi:glycosyltransferase involved in cell wall biosynthesis